jgi:hypothetical protein
MASAQAYVGQLLLNRSKYPRQHAMWVPWRHIVQQVLQPHEHINRQTIDDGRRSLPQEFAFEGIVTFNLYLENHRFPGVLQKAQKLCWLLAAFAFHQDTPWLLAALVFRHSERKLVICKMQRPIPIIAVDAQKNGSPWVGCIESKRERPVREHRPVAMHTQSFASERVLQNLKSAIIQKAPPISANGDRSHQGPQGEEQEARKEVASGLSPQSV